MVKTTEKKLAKKKPGKKILPEINIKDLNLRVLLIYKELKELKEEFVGIKEVNERIRKRLGL